MVAYPPIACSQGPLRSKRFLRRKKPRKHLSPLNVLWIRKGAPVKAKRENPGDLLQGTLDLLILKALARGAMHGYGVAEWIHETSEDILRVEEGALYPALHRLELRGLLSSAWGASDNNRRAKFYSLTVAGQKQLAEETEFWRRMSGAVARILQTA
jgi:PadR family transcriptional regulator